MKENLTRELKIDSIKKTIQKYFSPVDIKINGDRPWDIHIHNPQFYTRVLAGGSLALGESYMEGWWDCKQLDEFINRILKGDLDQKVRSKSLMWNAFKAKILNMQNKTRAYEVGRKHYDVGNELYSLMLDKNMVYTCGYWKDTNTLDESQEQKLDLVCKKIGLKKGQRILDIGCGWGSFMKFAAQKYGVSCVGVTISKEQVKLAREKCKGLPIEIRLEDYRDLNEKFDHIVSLGMFEHVGYKNYRIYMKVVKRCLKKNGLFLLHTIGTNKSVSSIEPWIAKYIFPNSMLPSVKQISDASEGLFVLEDLHNFGNDYDQTLMAWESNFTNNWDQIKEKYDHKFYRMWKYYLLSCAGTFRSRKNQLWQIVFSKNGVKGGYQSIY